MILFAKKNILTFERKCADQKLVGAQGLRPLLTKLYPDFSAPVI